MPTASRKGQCAEALGECGLRFRVWGVKTVGFAWRVSGFGFTVLGFRV